MMAAKHPYNAIHALQSVFAVPALRAPARPFIQQHRCLCPRPQHQSFSISAARLKEVTEKRKQKWNEEIKARMIYLVDPETDRLIEEPRKTSDVLRRLDTKDYRLVQFTPDPDPQSPDYKEAMRDFIPVCKVLSKREMMEREKEQKKKKQEDKAMGGGAASMKTIELNWAIDPNDLGHRMGKLEGFLSAGRRVEVVLAAKKRGRKATPQECETLLAKLRKLAVDVGGKEFRPFEGKMGGFATMILQGPSQKASNAKKASAGDGNGQTEQTVQKPALKIER